MTYIVYSYHKSKAAALWAIEDYFATGEIFESDNPRVVRMKNGRYAVEVLDGSFAY